MTANKLVKFVSSVFVKEPDWTWVLSENVRANISEKLKIGITKEIIKNKLTELNPNKSPDPDGLHPKVFKELPSLLVNPLFLLFNASL